MSEDICLEGEQLCDFSYIYWQNILQEIKVDIPVYINILDLYFLHFK